MFFLLSGKKEENEVMVPGERRKKKLHLLCLSGKTDEAAYVSDASGVHVVFFRKWKYVGYVGEPCRLGFFFCRVPSASGLTRKKVLFFAPSADFGRSRRSGNSRQLGSCEPIGNSVFMFWTFFCVCFEQGKVPKCEDKRPKSILASGSMHSKRIDFFLGKLNW